MPDHILELICRHVMLRNVIDVFIHPEKFEVRHCDSLWLDFYSITITPRINEAAFSCAPSESPIGLLCRYSLVCRKKVSPLAYFKMG
jgi:hypothetical protein